MKKYLFFCFFLINVSTVLSQDTTLRNNYKSLILEKGNYYVSNNITIEDSFVVKPGVSIIFSNQTILQCNGYVNIAGTLSDNVKLIGNDSIAGTGLVISANRKSDIVNISFTSFNNLSTPIRFDNGWFRNQVSIVNSIFKNNLVSNSIIQLNAPFISLGDSGLVCNFEIIQNLFSYNKSPIFIEDLTSNYLKLNILNNTFYSNYVYGFGVSSFSNNLFVTRSDNVDSKFIATIKNNSFVNNIVLDPVNDTIIRYSDFGIYGNSKSFNLDSNYWNNFENEDVFSRIYDYKKNYTSPNIVIDNKQSTPDNVNPVHIFKATTFYGSDLMKRDKIEKLKLLDSAFIYTNKPIITDKSVLKFLYFDDSLNVIEYKIQHNLIDKDGISFLLIKPDTIYDKLKKEGYFVLSGLNTKSGEELPPIYFGYNHFLKTFFLTRQLKNNKIPVSSTDTIKLPKLKYNTTLIQKKFEVSLQIGSSIYLGTLSNSSLFSNDFNASFGVEVNYSFKKHYTVKLGIGRTNLSGSDYRSGDSEKFKRGMSFLTPITYGGAHINYDFINNTFFDTKLKFRPYLGLGFNYIKFNPRGQYLGTWYDLQPLGTSGQTQLDANIFKPYSLNSLSTTFTFGIKRYVTPRTGFYFQLQYNFVFSDFLDDVGPAPYVNSALIRLANPQAPDAAAFFANPTNRVFSEGQLRSGSSQGNDNFLIINIGFFKRF